jgi:hypothetical protein
MKNPSTSRIGIEAKVEPNMKTNVSQLWPRVFSALFAAAGLAVLGGCASGEARAPAPSGFLTHYFQLKQIDPQTWRYVNSRALANYNKFRIDEIKVLATYFNGSPLPDYKKQRIEDYVRQSISKALSDHYSIVSALFT